MRFIGETLGAIAGLAALAIGGPFGVVLGGVGFSHMLGSALTATGGPLRGAAGGMVVATPLEVLGAVFHNWEIRDGEWVQVKKRFRVSGPFLFTEAQWSWYSRVRTAQNEANMCEMADDHAGAHLASVREQMVLGGKETFFLKEAMIKADWLDPSQVSQDMTYEDLLQSDPSYFLLSVAKAQAAAITDPLARYKWGLPEANDTDS